MIIEGVITFVVILAGVWFLTEVLQKAWYETVVTNLPARVLLASIIFTAVQLYSHLRIENLFAEGLPYLIGTGIVWVLGFLMVLQFASNHALGLGLSGMLILTSLAGMASDGFQPVGRQARINTRAEARKPIRTPRYNSAVIPFQQPTPGSSVQAKPASNASPENAASGSTAGSPAAAPATKK